MNVKKLIKQGQFKFEQNKGLIFTILAGTFEIAAIIAMAKQAPKAEKVLIPANKRIEELKLEMKDDEKIANHQVYVEDNKKEIRKIQTKTFVNLAKVYALPVIFTGLSLTFMGGSYKVMRDKEIALGAAYVTLDNAYKVYRNRVKEKFGEDAENEIFRDIREKKVLRQVENPETGEIEEVEDVVREANAGGGWELVFDAASILWSHSGRTNYETLIQKQRECDCLLRSQGYLFLSDVIEILGIPKTTIDKDILCASRVVGWLDEPDEDGMPKKVLFGISDRSGHPNEIGQDMFDNIEKDCVLSLNVDGNILKPRNGKSFAKYVKD